FTSEGVISIRNNKWKDDFSPIDPDSPAPSSRLHTRAYLRHLFVSGEILGMQLASIQNLAFYLWLVREARKRILSGDFVSWKTQMVKRVSARL
ncbi:MAG: tRNA-guanine transglycosylase, partial [Saprospiraceae bacterium]